jgi:SNF2 family DNA or RNA helicase
MTFPQKFGFWGFALKPWFHVFLNAGLMHWRAANRLYSKRSLQQWRDRLVGGWEDRFGSEAIKRGRKLYRKGSVREVSIGDDDAIVTCKIGKSEDYSVVDWENGSFSVRSSSTDSVFADAIAVAGFLEIEELIADEELNYFQEESREEKEPSGVSGYASIDEPDIGTAEERMLHLVLDTHFRGLICEAYWLSDEGSREPALSVAEGAPMAKTADERGRLISLAARAHKSHFTYSQEFNGYLLTRLQEIPFFIQNVWPGWKRLYSTEERENVSNIRDGFKELNVQAKAKLESGGRLALGWSLGSGSLSLSDELARNLVDSADSHTLIPEIGIVTLSSDSKELLKRWEALEPQEDDTFKPYQLFSLFPDGKTNVELDEALLKWRDSLLLEDCREASFLPCLRAYQLEGVQWMERLLAHDCHCLLADEMGLGKTLQVIALMQEALSQGGKALIICPASVVPVWISEFEKFAPKLKAVRYTGKEIDRVDKDWDALVTSFALMRNRIEFIKDHEFEYAIVDEAQFIKNPDAKVTRAAMRIKAGRRVALTGTPIENRPLDIWPCFRFLMPGLLGRRRSFERELQENPNRFKARLRAQIAPFMLRRTKEQVAKDLPEKILIDQICPITPRQSKEYSRICGAGIARLGNDLGSALKGNRFAALSLLTRLRQASCDPDLLPWVTCELKESGKLMVLLEKLQEVLGTGHKVVIFSQFVQFLNRVKTLIGQSFPDLPLFELTGATKDRETPVREFQAIADTAAMLVSLRAGGSGITLHAADYVFLMDPWWNPAVENQAIDRVHRIGQSNTVFVYKMIAKGTIEERIQDLKRDKQELFESLVQNSGLGAEELARQYKSLEALLILSQND